jgi:hypothetical protein
VAYVAVFLAVTSLFTAAGPVLGGVVLKALPAEIARVAGWPILSFHLLFVLAAIGTALTTRLLHRVREPSEQPVASVWRQMRKMPAFNPMLSIQAAGELLLTPRGFLALGRRSIRSVRRQVKALEDVSDEIISGGREILDRKHQGPAAK